MCLGNSYREEDAAVTDLWGKCKRTELFCRDAVAAAPLCAINVATPGRRAMGVYADVPLSLYSTGSLISFGFVPETGVFSKLFSEAVRRLSSTVSAGPARRKGKRIGMAG